MTICCVAFCWSTRFLFAYRHQRFRDSLTPYTVSRVLRIPQQGRLLTVLDHRAGPDATWVVQQADSGRIYVLLQGQPTDVVSGRPVAAGSLVALVGGRGRCRGGDDAWATGVMRALRLQPCSALAWLR